MLRSADAFEDGCDVAKIDGVIDCGTCPGVSCHVKDATAVFNRMGDMGNGSLVNDANSSGISAAVRIGCSRVHH